VRQQLLTMLELQDAMNRRVHSDWRQRGFEWYRAIWVECAELMDHYGWKWWKKQVPDRHQVQLELVDIWHFGLSILLLAEQETDRLAADLESIFRSGPPPGDFRRDLEAFALATLRTRGFDGPGFVRLMSDVDFGFDELYRRYVGKNVLNFFRQDHGYQQGTYRKTWQGREDNEHLVEIIATLDTGHSAFQDHLYQALQDRYLAAGGNPPVGR